MKQSTLKKNHTDLRQISPSLVDHNCGCYAEEYFQDVLIMERKRAERTRKPFLLMLLDMSDIQGAGERRAIAKKAADVLSSITRETDIKGWYRSGEVLGVIFTEMTGIDSNLFKEKIYANGSDVLSTEQIAQISISFHVFPEKDETKPSGTPTDLTLYPDLPKKEKVRKTTFWMKRILDVVGGIAGIIIFSPFFILIPLFIKLSSKGPVLFKQERVGQYGKMFTFLKFRSMYTDCDHTIHKDYVHKLISGEVGKDAGGDGAQKKVFKITDDCRVTSIGKILRKTSLDELPQFINVLKGDMSLVGPRPPIPYEVEKYDIWHRRRVMEVKPGITGLWQVKGRSSTSFDDMVRLDIQYAREWSLWLDVKLLLMTPWAVVKGKGAY